MFYYKLALNIGIAFGLFGLSYLITLARIGGLSTLLIIIRVLAYLIVVFALYKTKSKKETFLFLGER